MIKIIFWKIAISVAKEWSLYSAVSDSDCEYNTCIALLSDPDSVGYVWIYEWAEWDLDIKVLLLWNWMTGGICVISCRRSRRLIMVWYVGGLVDIILLSLICIIHPSSYHRVANPTPPHTWRLIIPSGAILLWYGPLTSWLALLYYQQHKLHQWAWTAWVNIMLCVSSTV